MMNRGRAAPTPSKQAKRVEAGVKVYAPRVLASWFTQNGVHVSEMELKHGQTPSRDKVCELFRLCMARIAGFDVALFDSAPRNWIENEPDANESIGDEAAHVQQAHGQMILPNAAFDALRPAMPRIMLFSVMKDFLDSCVVKRGDEEKPMIEITMRDLLQPETTRVQQILSVLIDCVGAVETARRSLFTPIVNEYEATAAEFDRMREEAKQLEESMERMRQEKAAAEKQAACIRQVWMQTTAQNDACVENIAMMEALKEQLNENIKQCAAEVETLQVERTAAERRCVALDADIVTSPTRIRNEIKTLTKHKEEVEREIDEAMKTYRNYTNIISSRTAVIDRLKTCERQIHTMESKQEEATELQASLSKAHNELRSAMMDLQSIEASTENKRQTINGMNEDHANRMESLRAKIESNNKKIAEINDETEKIRKDLRSKADTVKSMRQQMDIIEQRREDAEAYVKKANAQYDDIIARMVRKMERIEEEHKEQLRAYVKRLDSWKKEIDMMNDAFAHGAAQLNDTDDATNTTTSTRPMRKTLAPRNK